MKWMGTMDLDNKGFEQYLLRTVKNNYNNVGQAVVNKINLLMEESIGQPTKLTETISYKIIGNELKIYSSTPIVKFIDEGTKPHIIRPKKPGGALAFRAQEVVTRKDGKKISFGDKVITKEVKHPGFVGYDFVSKAIFLAQKDIVNEFFRQK